MTFAPYLYLSPDVLIVAVTPNCAILIPPDNSSLLCYDILHHQVDIWREFMEPRIN